MGKEKQKDNHGNNFLGITYSDKAWDEDHIHRYPLRDEDLTDAVEYLYNLENE